MIAFLPSSNMVPPFFGGGHTQHSITARKINFVRISVNGTLGCQRMAKLFKLLLDERQTKGLPSKRTGAPQVLCCVPRTGLVGHDAFGPGLNVLDAQDVGDLGHAVDAGKLGGGSLDVLLERAVRQEDDRAGIADA